MSCPSCGQFQSGTSFDSIELNNVSDLTSSIMSFLMACREGTCPRCQNHKATFTYIEVDLPQCAMISLERQAFIGKKHVVHLYCYKPFYFINSCAKDFKLSFELYLDENKYSLRSIMVQPQGKPYVFIGICPDGLFRKFEDSRVI